MFFLFDCISNLIPHNLLNLHFIKLARISFRNNRLAPGINTCSFTHYPYRLLNVYAFSGTSQPNQLPPRSLHYFNFSPSGTHTHTHTTYQQFKVPSFVRSYIQPHTNSYARHVCEKKNYRVQDNAAIIVTFIKHWCDEYAFIDRSDSRRYDGVSTHQTAFICIKFLSDCWLYSVDFNSFPQAS